MNEKKIEKYLKTKGIRCNLNVKDIKEAMDEMYRDSASGWEMGGLVFKKSKSGRKYIEFVTTRCYLD